MNIGFYMIIFQFTRSIGADTGWEKYHFYIFLATTWLINSLVQAFFMPNAEEFSELIRTGGLDFALLKPIDTQFLISFRRIDWSALSNFFVGLALLFWAVYRLMTDPVNPMTFSLLAAFLYVFYIGCGALIMYSLMICLSATSVWLGRNQTLYNFWFYITNFSRYPMEIYQRSWGWSLWGLFTFAIPVLVVVNVPARILARPLDPRAWWEVPLAVYALFATVISLAASRWIFKKSLGAYRSASS
ncbi:hypothetical protein FF011L_51260 [Roseimaritima multifibrata]|uniref:ABC-2 family transporter protein n=2 Tax=Roseimaritima multifibrata TaxID=1930274 RepID=A0A517MN50_9BACT|nr:hypothetical protein FF011L_51260 [Roseimaritima multifibrata]